LQFVSYYFFETVQKMKMKKGNQQFGLRFPIATRFYPTCRILRAIRRDWSEIGAGPECRAILA